MKKFVRFFCFLSVFSLLFGIAAAPVLAEAKKDTLVVALTSEPPSLSTNEHDSLISVGMNLQIFSALVKINNKTLLPELQLAESYSIANDTEWTFKLKKGVKFHNGEELTAHDVKASIEYAKTFPASILYTGSIDKIEVPDDYTVKLITKQPYAGLLYDLGYHFNFILPKSLIEAKNDFNKNPVGSGPYKLKEWVFGDHITMERFDDYFDKDHIAKIKTLVFKIIPEGASRAIALEAGEVDFVWEVNGADVKNLEGNDKLTVIKVNTVDNVMMFLNNDKPPFDNKDLRLAINYAINRKDIIAGALNGIGKESYSTIAQGYWGSTEKNATTFDLEKAKEHLKKWGGDPASIKMPIMGSNETRVNIATIIQGNLSKIGIKAEVVPMDTATYFAKWAAGEYTAILASWSPSNSLTYVSRFHSDRRKSSPGSLNDPKIDELVLKAKATIDDKARLALIEEIVGEVNLLSPQISLFLSVWVRAHDSNLDGVVCSATGYTDYFDMYWK